jgi:ABC-type molybdate transport system substrate-binding protein
MRTIALALMGLLLLAGCPQQQANDTGNQPASTESTARAESDAVVKQRPTLTVWADPALETVLGELGSLFKELEGYPVAAEFYERGELQAKLADTAAKDMPDVVIFADPETLEMADGLYEPETLRTIAGDRLVLVERQGFGYKTPTLFDIYKLRFEHIGLGEQGTISGYYGEQALIADGVMQRIEDRIARYASEDALTAALLADETQAALVLASTAANSEVSAWYVIGEDLHEDIRYQAAAGAGKADKPGVMELLTFLAEDEDVQQVFEGFGHVRREMALGEER